MWYACGETNKQTPWKLFEVFKFPEYLTNTYEFSLLKTHKIILILSFYILSISFYRGHKNRHACMWQHSEFTVQDTIRPQNLEDFRKYVFL